jgi:uncharacterized membrane protein (DUF4010 family)
MVDPSMPELILSIVASAGLGALIGLIRQWGEQSDRTPGDFAGVRTHTFWAVLGCLGAYATREHSPYALPAVILLVGTQLIARVVKGNEPSPPGSTTFAGALVTLFCGAMVFWGETKAAVLVAATTMVLLGLKQRIHDWTKEITDQDIRATLQFVAISGVILPLVPDRSMGPFQAFNPYSTWLMVVLIGGLGFAGYLAIRLVGPRAGILVTGLLGGLASSTASTMEFSRRSREEPKMSEHYAIAVAAACTVMLPRVLIATSLVNRTFALTLLVPFALMAVPGLGYAMWAWLWRRPGRHKGDTPRLGNPLNLGTAIKFALLYAGIAAAVTIVSQQGWTEGLMPLSFVSGLTDMDAISLSMARDGGEEKIALPLAARAVVLAAVSNTMLKAGMALVMGSAGLRWRIGLVLGATMLIGLGWLWWGDPAFVPFFPDDPGA